MVVVIFVAGRYRQRCVFLGRSQRCTARYGVVKRRGPRHRTRRRSMFASSGASFQRSTTCRLRRVRRAVIVDEASCRSCRSCRPPACRRLRNGRPILRTRMVCVLRMRHIKVDVADFRPARIDHHDLVCPLQEIERLSRRIGVEARHARRASSVRARGTAPCRQSRRHWPFSSTASPVLQDGIG